MCFSKFLSGFALVALIGAAGCSSTKSGGHNYPPMDLVQESPAPAVQVTPAPDLSGVQVGVDVAALRPWRMDDTRAAQGLGKVPAVLVDTAQNVAQTGADIGRATWAHKGKVALGVGAALAVNQGYHQDLIDFVRNKESKSDPGASGAFDISDEGASGEFENVTGSVTATLEKEEPLPEGEGVKKTKVTITFDQDDKD